MLFLVLAALLQAPPSVRTIGKGAMSGIDAALTVAVRSGADWSAVWTRHGGVGEPPPVDFSREMVVGVFLGRRPTGGYSVEIVRAVGAPGALIVEYIEKVPPRDAVTAQVLTAPYHLAVVPKHDGQVTFKTVER